MNDKEIIESYLSENIPLTKALGISLDLVSNHQVVINAPLRNNINHQSTVFGGSLHAVATLACWSLLYKHFIHQLDNLEIVISHSEIDYLLPVTSDFKAICFQPDGDTWSKFSKILSKKGKARISLNAKIHQSDHLAVDYQGTFVVIHAAR